MFDFSQNHDEKPKRSQEDVSLCQISQEKPKEVRRVFDFAKNHEKKENQKKCGGC